MDNAERSYQFWNRVDLLRGNLQLNDLANKAGIKYQRIKEQRSSGRIPSVEDVYKISTVLNTSIEYLLTGENGLSLSSPEAKAVSESPELQALVRAVMRDPQLLSALATVIESSERANIG